MGVDLVLFVSLGLGFLAGRFLPHPGAWVGRLSMATVLLLVGALGLILSTIPPARLLEAVPVALAFAATILGATVAVEQVWVRRLRGTPPAGAPPPPSEARRQLWFPPALLVALTVGLALGPRVSLPGPTLLTGALYLLLFLVGFDLKVRIASVRAVAIPTVSCLIGAFVSAGWFSFALGLPLRWTLSTSFAFGWYSLAGPLLTQGLGPMAGLLGFLTNFLRENLTMLTAPLVGRRLKGDGLTAMGGATSLDTTLYFITRYGGEDSGVLALSSGLLLTLAASVLVPFLLGVGGLGF
ncbi:MAG: lysine exporter LysO family protein [Thermoplasmata archaeon]|nr:lysine exporter LysO family protein [Thermoplasmata archaeon]MCI4359813.1 lysine exporter LysO family protein [Thermoplasmata archaeon]